MYKRQEKEYVLYQNLVSDMKRFFHYANPNELSLEEREKGIIELFKLLSCNSLCANLKVLNKDYSKTFGRKNEKVIDQTTFVNISPSGLYRRIEQ